MAYAWGNFEDEETVLKKKMVLYLSNNSPLTNGNPLSNHMIATEVLL